MDYMLYIIIGAILIEIILNIVVNYFRGEFQWIITSKDECPVIDGERLKKFLINSHDPVLGWTRKPNTYGEEKGGGGKVKFYIDHQGSRHLPGVEGTDPEIACFGDSFTFCRQVENNETWQYYLCKKLNKNILNFGVGNYGVDQALLRYERTELPGSTRFVILGFVPETICRIHSFWKHYLEFGNTFAFKPRFSLAKGGLKLHPNAMQTAEDFSLIRDKLFSIQKEDYFYHRKFRETQFRFPYALSYLRRPERNSLMIGGLLYRKMYGFFTKSVPSEVKKYPYEIVMENNIKEASEMYKTTHATELLKLILLRFKESAEKRKHIPIILVMPQLGDLKLGKRQRRPCSEFFDEMGRDLKVINVSKSIDLKNASQYYVEDYHSGHFSSKGNKVVAATLERELKGLWECGNA